jgi:hypothetical protein
VNVGGKGLPANTDGSSPPLVFEPLSAFLRCKPFAVTRDVSDFGLEHKFRVPVCLRSPATTDPPGGGWLRDQSHSRLRMRERTMPRFYFNVRDGAQLSHTDEVGEELADANAAWTLAISYTGEILRDLDGKLKPEADWRLEVISEGGHPVCSVFVRGKLEAA